jgi:NNP family nitrate/nitrite transporter-like MFS transporter
MGNGAVFQLVPQRFAGRVGIMTGIVGAAGGLGGFLLPSLLGTVRDRAGTFGLGFALVAAAMLAGAGALVYLGRVWRTSWSEESAIRAGLLVDANICVETVSARQVLSSGPRVRTAAASKAG